MLITFAMVSRYGKDAAGVTRYKRLFGEDDQELTEDYIKRIIDTNGMNDLYWLIEWLGGCGSSYESWINAAAKYANGKQNVDFTKFIQRFGEKVTKFIQRFGEK